MEKRLDIYLVENMGIKSRSKAQELIRGGFVTCNGKKASKTGLFVSEKDDIKILQNDVLKYVSRGGLKLEKAIQEFELDLIGKTILDIGSSTGGFTDCALQHGAKKVVAVDVGTDIMDAGLRTSPALKISPNSMSLSLLTKDKLLIPFLSSAFAFATGSNPTTITNVSNKAKKRCLQIVPLLSITFLLNICIHSTPITLLLD